MKADEVLTGVRDAVTVKRVYGDAYERDGVTIIPAAAVRGAGGGGGGSGSDGEEGSGAGFGLQARPVGAYVIRDGDVAWEPAVDVTRLAILGQVVGIIALLVLRSVVKSLRKRR